MKQESKKADVLEAAAAVEQKKRSPFIARRAYPPLCLLLITVLSIFVSETVVTMAMSNMAPVSTMKGAVIDSLSLIALVFPLLYVFILNPMRRLINEQNRLITELREAAENIRTLKGLLPMCAWCKKIRDDRGYWKKVETYIKEHSEASFTHGICPDCLKTLDPLVYEQLKKGGHKTGGSAGGSL